MPAVDVYRTLWRYRIMILVLTALAGIAAYGFTQTQPKIYQADALIRIQQRGAPAEVYGSLTSLELGQRLAQTYTRIVQTRTIHEQVAETLEGEVPSGDISISASPVGDLEMLSISARSERPRVAAAVANATTDSLRSYITESGTLRDQIVVIDDAAVPSVPVSPRTKFTVAIALLFALIFNCALALARGFFSDPLPEVDKWEEKFGRPVLATVPALQLKNPSAVLSPRPDLSEAPAIVRSTEALAGPTRWSVGVPEGGRRGD